MTLTIDIIFCGKKKPSKTKIQKIVNEIKRGERKRMKQHNLENNMIQKYVAPQSPYYTEKQKKQIRKGRLL